MHWTLAILNLLFLQSTYGINVGVGISDITGPAAEIGMMGYAKQGQNTKGIHMYKFNQTRYVFDLERIRISPIDLRCYDFLKIEFSPKFIEEL